MDYGIGKKMTRPVKYILDRKYIGFAVKLFHRASAKSQKARKLTADSRRFTQMGTERKALSAWRKATNLVTSNECCGLSGEG